MDQHATLENVLAIPQAMAYARTADQDKEKVWNGLVDILIELQRHPFPKAGSTSRAIAIRVAIRAGYLCACQ